MSALPDPTDPLGQPCPKCDLAAGDHTLRDWITHTEVGFHEIPLFKVDPEGNETPIEARLVDNLDVRVMVANSPLGRLGIVEMHWQVGAQTGPNRSIARVAFTGTPVVLRAAGRLIRDSMNHAANLAEGKR